MRARSSFVHRGVGVIAALAVAASPAAALADAEAWSWVEVRVPLVDDGESFPRTTWRLWTDVRANSRSDGLHLSFFRTGPVVDVLPWLALAAHATVIGERLPAGEFRQEVRAELEPTVWTRIGDFLLLDRNRLEYRAREAQDDQLRYRNLVRLHHQPKGAWLVPFVWNEMLLPLTELGQIQNRTAIGTGFMLRPHVRLDLGYMLRARLDAGQAVPDHVALLYLFVDAPRARPFLPPASRRAHGARSGQ